MAICMKMGAGHIHEAACDEAVANGRTTTVVAVRMPDEQARAVRSLIENSPRGYASVSEFINHLIATQALRRRGTQLRRREEGYDTTGTEADRPGTGGGSQRPGSD